MATNITKPGKKTLWVPDGGTQHHLWNIVAKKLKPESDHVLLVPTANIQAIQGAEEHIKKPQKGNQQKPNYGKQ